MKALDKVTPGMQIVYGGNRIATVSDAVAERFQPGDRLFVVQTTGEILHVPAAQWQIASEAVSRAYESFQQIASVSHEAISEFFKDFAARLEEGDVWSRIEE
ncbi:MAG TPA: glutamate-5-semialdehyde dehydrogenase, partial [Dehalococcoidia bacterium]|nr:glutamate-5-semialdehyde dehydrogenase [Dehalococcoidia bacterium]